ncbi:MAG: hypothetical protein ACI9V1_000714 [Spirosomataceae bacterium]|jgi:hypothetical protein
METLLLLIIATTAILESYLLVNLISSFLSKNSGSEEAIICENYQKRQQEHNTYSNFQERIIKKTSQLRTARTY